MPLGIGGFPDFLQMTPENMATARNTSWGSALGQDFNPKNPNYQGFRTAPSNVAQGSRVGLGSYINQGLRSLMGNFQGGSNVGGATTLMRKMAMSPVGTAARTALSLPALAGYGVYKTPDIINALTERDPDATKSSLFGIDLTHQYPRKYTDIDAYGEPTQNLNTWGALNAPDDFQRSAFQDDANYVPRQTMARNWSELDDAEAQPLGISRQQDEDEDTGKGDWLRNIASFIPFLGKNTRSGAALRMLTNRFMPEGGITSIYNRGYNRGQPRDPNLGRGLSGNVSWAGQQYDKQYGTGQYHIYNLKKRLDRLQKSKSASEWNRKQKEKVAAEIRAKQQATHEARQRSTPGYGADPGGRQSVDTSGSRGPAGKEMM